MKSATLLVAVALLGASVCEFWLPMVPMRAMLVAAFGMYCLGYRSASYGCQQLLLKYRGLFCIEQAAKHTSHMLDRQCQQLTRSELVTNIATWYAPHQCLFHVSAF